MKAYTVLSALSVCLLFLAPASAQSEPEKGVEIFGGYARGTSSDFCCVGRASGYHLGVGYTPVKFLLLGSDFSHADGPDPAYVRHLHLGPQFRLSLNVMRPFARLMAGFTEHRSNCAPSILAYRRFSYGIGGGLDLHVHRRAAVRIVSLDRIRMEDQWDLRASFGAVFLLF